ncbi:MAG TPA: Gfo/Idh/MocA family oxidoreductase [Chloroflexota bacterium]|nr:Gfo/Idh/MocA family oxidoreductase [Chloroflexota bacterium]
MPEPMRFAVIGINGQGRAHLRGLKETPGAQLVAVCDVNEDAARARGEEYGVPYFTSYEDVLKRDDVDAVGLPLPHYLHSRVAIAAFQAGKHVVTEKPMAISVRECDEMIAAAQKAGKQLTISHQGRAAPGVRYIRDLLHSPDFGRLIRMVWLSGGTRTQYYYDTEEWRGTWAEEGGGTLINQKVHDLDRLAYLLGLPAELSAFTSNLFHKVEPLVETMASASLLWADGAVGTFQASITDGGTDLSRQEYHGDRACLVQEGRSWKIGQFSMPAGDYIARGIGPGPQHKPPADDPRNQLKVDVSWEEVALPEAGPGESGYPAVYEALVRAARGEGSVAITPEEARNAIELMNGMTLSSLRRKAVKLPLDRDEVDDMFAELRQIGGRS